MKPDYDYDCGDNVICITKPEKSILGIEHDIEVGNIFQVNSITYKAMYNSKHDKVSLDGCNSNYNSYNFVKLNKNNFIKYVCKWMDASTK